MKDRWKEHWKIGRRRKELGGEGRKIGRLEGIGKRRRRRRSRRRRRLEGLESD